MHILGLSSGSTTGTSETLLKIALKEASALIDITASFLRVSALSMPAYPLPGIYDPASTGATEAGAHGAILDDHFATLNAILNADALIVASPIYTRQVAGVLKYFCDQTLGPYVDAAFIEEAIASKTVGNPHFRDFKPDHRVLKPRDTALIAAGGATSKELSSLVLPVLHQTVFSLHAKVVEQLLVQGASNPGVFLTDEAIIERARQLGRNVASQVGRALDDPEYMDDETGCCPHCKLSTIVIHGTPANNIDCAVCGANGRLFVDENSHKIRVEYFDEPATSVPTMKGKRMHMDEIKTISVKFGAKMREAETEVEEWKRMDALIVEVPSTRRGAWKYIARVL